MNDFDPTAHQASDSDPVAEIRAREEALVESKNHPGFVEDPCRILEFYNTNSIRLFDLHENWLDGDAVGEMLKVVSPTFIGQASLHDVRIEASGDVGFSYLIESYVGHLRDSGEAVTLNFRQTHGWKKIDGKWLIVHEHWSFPVDAATGQARTTDPLP